MQSDDRPVVDYSVRVQAQFLIELDQYECGVVD